LIYGTATDKGLIRSINEDSIKVYHEEDHYPLVLILADGMGGHRKGELASKVAVDYVFDQVSKTISGLNDTQDAADFLRETTEKANIKVYLGSIEDDDNHGMGTTLTIAAIYEKVMIVAHVGDCRAYILRKNLMMRITVDHTLVQELVDLDKITSEQAMKHPKRHILTRALGIPEYVTSEIYTVALDKSDRILLCSDGLYGFVPESLIKTTVKKGKNPAETASRLVEYANAAGGEDNVTVAVIHV
jgi:PPM family protein phosphatase